MFKYELHSHTRDGDLYASLSGQELVKVYYNAGYNGIVITNHYFKYFFDWFKDELDGLAHKDIICRYLRGYYSAKNEGEKLGVTVLCGAEVRLENAANDYLIYGLNEDDFYNLPLLCYQKNLGELISILPSDALVVQAHPFRKGTTIIDPEMLFGMEVFNRGTEDYRNTIAFDYAKHYGKAMTSGSDCHGSRSVATGGIETEMPIYSSQDLCSVLRSGKYSLIMTK